MSTRATPISVKKPQNATFDAPRHKMGSQPTARLVDNRPTATVQGKLQEAMATSPRLQQQRLQQEQIDNSPRMRQLKAQQPTQGSAPAATKASLVQRAASEAALPTAPAQKSSNKTGLPDKLKAGVEHLSGLSLDDVQVHYNSAAPAQLQAHAYAQGTDIHLGPGQEKHLPHEAWHVVQQKQGRVRPTRQLKGKTAINDNAALEREADVMGEKSVGTVGKVEYSLRLAENSTAPVAQLSEEGWREKLAAATAEKRGGGGGKKGGERKLSAEEMTAAHNKQKMKEYLDCIDHMQGECNQDPIKEDATITGGHLLTEMRSKWGDKLKLIEPTVAPTGNKSWKLYWALVANPEAQESAQKQSKTKMSSMFPAAWTKADLIRELEGSSSVGDKRELLSKIIVTKSGKTFYPVQQ